MNDFKLLIGLSKSELETLVNVKVPPKFQEKLSDLLTKNHEGIINQDELAELDNLLSQVDKLTLLKAQAMYTLQQH